jgi:ACS family tartrate transporter-like MFS transporter
MHGRVPDDVGARASRKVGRRLIPFLALLYFAAFLDRVNVGFAALQMNRDLGFTAYVYGLGAGIFFIGYCLFEVPSNLLLHRLGGRRWISRIMISWGLVAGATAFVHGAVAFCALRFLLGVAEAGFFPGVIFYLTHWVPAAQRARVVGAFMTAIPISTAVGGPLSTAILALDGRFGLAGWQWLFLLETLPSLVLGAATFAWLPDTPREARWLRADEREWLLATIEAERSAAPARVATRLAAALTHPRILALGVCYFGVQIALYGVILWVPQMLRSAGVDEARLGIAVAGPYALAALGMLLWSRHSDRSGERRWHLAAAAALAAAGLVATAALAEAPRLAIVSVSVSAVGTLAVLPIFWTLPAALLRGVAAAGAIALINAIGNIGGFVGPYLIGWIRDATGSFALGLLAAAAGVLLTGALALVIARPPAPLS